MAIRPILQLGDPRLREACRPVPRSEQGFGPEISELICDLRDTVRDSRARTGYGRAIAAPQLGALLKVVYLDLPQELVLINPKIVWKSPEVYQTWDACLSFLSIFMQVPRHREIEVSYFDESGLEQLLRAGGEGDLAELLQHEIDHLDGVLIIDRVIDLHSICTREEFEKRFAANTPYQHAVGGGL